MNIIKTPSSRLAGIAFTLTDALEIIENTDLRVYCVMSYGRYALTDDAVDAARMFEHRGSTPLPWPTRPLNSKYAEPVKNIVRGPNGGRVGVAFNLIEAKNLFYTEEQLNCVYCLHNSRYEAVRDMAGARAFFKYVQPALATPKHERPVPKPVPVLATQQHNVFATPLGTRMGVAFDLQTARQLLDDPEMRPHCVICLGGDGTYRTAWSPQQADQFFDGPVATVTRAPPWATQADPQATKPVPPAPVLGYAVVGAGGWVDPQLVGPTVRAAMVNWLVVNGVEVFNTWSDETVGDFFDNVRTKDDRVHEVHVTLGEIVD